MRLPVKLPDRQRDFRVYRTRSGRAWRAAPEGWDWQAALLPPVWLYRNGIHLGLGIYLAAALVMLIILPAGLRHHMAGIMREIQEMPAFALGMSGDVARHIELFYKLSVLSRLEFWVVGFFGFGLYGSRIRAWHYGRMGYERIGQIFTASSESGAIERAQRLGERQTGKPR